MISPRKNNLSARFALRAYGTVFAVAALALAIATAASPLFPFLILPIMILFTAAIFSFALSASVGRRATVTERVVVQEQRPAPVRVVVQEQRPAPVRVFTEPAFTSAPLHGISNNTSNDSASRINVQAPSQAPARVIVEERRSAVVPPVRVVVQEQQRRTPVIVPTRPIPRTPAFTSAPLHGTGNDTTNTPTHADFKAKRAPKVPQNDHAFFNQVGKRQRAEQQAKNQVENPSSNQDKKDASPVENTNTQFKRMFKKPDVVVVETPNTTPTAS